MDKDNVRAVVELSKRLYRCSVVGDGRCLFRAVAKGRAYAIGIDNREYR